MKQKNKSLIVFDLDGTLAKSKSPIDGQMANLLERLLEEKHVAVIGGGKYEQFQKQLIGRFKPRVGLREKLFLFPTTATAMYRFKKGGWQRVYALHLKKSESRKIIDALVAALKDAGHERPKKTYGKTIEHRGTQISFSPLGQKAPLEAKIKWNKNDTRPKIIRAIKKRLKGFEVRSGGLTTIDITAKGIDKAYGIRQIKKHLKISVEKMLFIGDAIFKGGNDHAVLKTKVDYIKVSGPNQTKSEIRKLLTK